MTEPFAIKTTPDDLDMHVIYDVSHNIAKVRVVWIYYLVMRSVLGDDRFKC